MRSGVRLAAWLGVAALGAGAGACLRETRHACEAAGGCDVDAAGAGDAAGGDDGGGHDAAPPIDARAGVIEHVPLAEEMLGTVALTVSENRTLDTSALTFNGNPQPWLSVITTDEGNQVALARLDASALAGDPAPI